MPASMRRRDFIAASAASLTGLAVYPLRGAERGALVRAAVVIGVDKLKGLPPLRAAVSGARLISDWLSSQGFEVKLFTDDQNPVQSSQLTRAITELVNRSTLDQLLIYFSGHGFLNGYTEYWLLSGAPADVNEAISLGESVELAREFGIASVIFTRTPVAPHQRRLAPAGCAAAWFFPQAQLRAMCRRRSTSFWRPTQVTPRSKSLPAIASQHFRGSIRRHS